MVTTPNRDRDAPRGAAQKVTHSTCYMCTMNCPITVTSQGGEITGIEHPPCVRAEAMEEQRDSESRWTEPRIRDDAEADWRTVNWNDALSHTAAKLKAIRDAHGGEAVAFLVGYTKEARPYLERLSYSFGSPHYITESSCCFGSASVGALVTLGDEYRYFFQTSRIRQGEVKARMVWSNNPAESLIPYDKHYLLAEAEKVPTIVVDPRRTTLAEAAAIHLQPRPGTDGALALGLAHVILAEGLEDKEFLAAHAHGFAEYAAYVREFTPERTQEITGVEAEKIIAAARLYGGARPAQLTVSQEATVQHSNGFQNHRAILLLPALTGNLDVAGGNKPFDHRLKEGNVTLRSELFPSLAIQMGAKEFPVFTEGYKEGQAMLLAEYIEQGRIKAVVSMGTNVMMWPNSERLAAALRQLELFTVCDFSHTPTVEAATVFFPAATHLERQALIVSPPGKVQYRPAAVPPRGSARGDTEMLFGLAEALGLGNSFWGGDIHASFDERLVPTGLTMADLDAGGKPRKVALEKPGERTYEDAGFRTPTGKIEFASTTLADAGFDALPVHAEPYWSPVGSPDVAADFPLVLTSGGRSNTYTHSQGRHFQSLKDREPEPRIQINPEDAEERGIADGDKVEVTSPLGALEMTAWVTDRLLPGVAHAFHGWPQANVNSLVPDSGLDPISGYPPFKSGLCQVRAL